jgi:zinc protease
LPGTDDADFAAGIVLADALDSRRGELYALAAEGKALSGGFDAAASPVAGFGYANAAFAHGQNSDALVAELKRIISSYVANGIPAELVEAIKRHEVAEAQFRRNSIAGLAAEWSQALAVEGRRSPDDDIEAIKKVTAEDVNRARSSWS